jgi:hypothetical protein
MFVVEASARDVLWDVYHAHATAELARRAARTGGQRAARVADLYAARHLAEAPAGRRAIRGALDDAVEIAYGPAMG